MTYKNRDRRCWIRDYKRTYSDETHKIGEWKGRFHIGEWKGAAIHQPPDVINPGDEFDFRICSGKGVFQLTLHCSNEPKILMSRWNCRNVVYIKVCFPFQTLGEAELTFALKAIARVGIPKAGIFHKTFTIKDSYGI